MPRETTEAKSARAKQIISGLRKTYPDAHCELNYSSPLELLSATILSAQCTDKRVNLVTAELCRKYGTAAHYAHARAAELEEALKTTGSYRHKTKSIQSRCRPPIAPAARQVPPTWYCPASAS